MGFWRTTISGVLATLLAGILAWFAGVWSDVWTWLKVAVANVWAWITGPIGIPLWLVVVAGLYMAATTIMLWALREPKAKSNSTSPPEPEPPLSELQNRVLAYLIQADGKWADWDHLHYGTGLSNLIVEQSLEVLFRRNLVLQKQDLLHGQLFRLSPKGRDYAIDQGLVNVGARYG